MPFQPGNKLAKGRPKGSLNQRSIEFAETLARHNFNPAEALMECYVEARKIYDSYALIYDAIRKAKSNDAGYDVPLEDKAHTYLKIAADVAKEIASYTYPKLKSIEKDKPNEALNGMSPEQRLEAMRQAVKYLEAQLGKKSD